MLDIPRDTKTDRANSVHASLGPGEMLAQANPLDFCKGLYQGTLGRPVDAIGQLFGQDAPAKPHNETLATKAGLMAGQIIDFSILAAASHGALKPLLRESINQTLGTSLKMFVAGSIDSGLLTASSKDKSLLSGRIENGLVGGATFAFMGGTGKALEGVNIVQHAIASKAVSYTHLTLPTNREV